MTTRRRFAVLRAFTAALGATIVSITVFESVTLTGVTPTVTFLSSFTALSNTFGFICFAAAALVAWRTSDDSAGFTVYRAANASYLIAMSILFLSIYGPSGIANGSIFAYGTFILHIVVPVLALVDWLFAPGSARLPFGAVGVMLLFPICWFVYTFARGVITQRYVYEFLDPALSGTTTPFVMGGALFAGFVASALVVITVNRFRTRPRTAVLAVPVEA